MSLHRLTSATLGVPDVDASAAFFTSFGLAPGTDGWFATRDGGEQLQLVPSPTRSLRRLGIAAEDPDDIARIAAAVQRLGFGTIVERTASRLVVTEPVTGLPVEITVAAPYKATADLPEVNAPSSVNRSNVPADSVLQPGASQPSNLTHVVYSTPDQPTTLRFFTEILGFEISDAIPGVIAFTRCGEVHHNVAIQAGLAAFPHHVAFEMDSIDDVVQGGQRMVEEDPDRHTWGLGRHAIGSNWFWYLRDPSGVFVEYTADIDRITDQDLYQPKDWEGHEFLYSYGPPTPAEFLEPSDLADLIEASS